MKSKTSLTILTLTSSLLNSAIISHAETPNPISKWWIEHGEFSLKNLSSVIYQNPAEVSLNENNLLNIPEYTLINEFRPEASIDHERLYLQVEPRFVAMREYVEDGMLADVERSKTETYIHEWIAQFFLTENLSISYGREDLQWGPSYLLSPSNPFDSRNGKSQPKTEVDAADFARITWTPNANWAITGIANIDDGRKEYRVNELIRQDFRDLYALKIDYLFNRGHLSMIASTTADSEDQDDRLGYYISYNATDALITYTEGSLSEGDEEILAGSTYTFESGISLSAEYFYNSSGITDPIPADGLELQTFEDYILSFPNREGFVRQNYGLIQIYKNDAFRSLDLLLRYTHNLDDSSRTLLGHLEFDILDNLGFFASATTNSRHQGELDIKRSYWIHAGLEFSF